MNIQIWKRIIRSRYGVSLGSCILLQGMLMAIVNPLLPIILSNRIGLDKSEITAFFLMITLIGIVISLGTGYLSDGTIARYKLVLGGGVISALGYLGTATATQPVHAFIAGPLIIAGIILFPQLFAVAKAGIVAGWERDAQVTGITALRTLFSFGYILGTGLASWLVQVMDIQAVCLLIAGGLLALTVWAALVLKQIERYIAQQTVRPVESTGSQPPETDRVILPIYALVIPLLALAVLKGADSTRNVYLPLIIFELFHDASLAPLMFGVTAVAELVTLGLISYLSSKVGEKAAISICALTGALYFIMLAFVQSLPLMYFTQVVYAIFNAALLGVAMAYVQGMLSHRAGMGGSVYVAILNLGSFVGLIAPLVVTGYDQRIFIIPAVMCVVGAVLLMLGDRTAQIEQRLRERAVQEARLQEAPRF